MTFQTLNLLDGIQRAIADIDYTIPTPIQEEAIPLLLEGRDLCGSAQTGTGKTAAFAIPILQTIALHRDPKKRFPTIQALVLAPTRELAMQIYENFVLYGKYLPLKVAVIFGGVPQRPQVSSLQEGVDILIATPGRLLDLYNQRFVKLQDVKHFVLDEADRMLDMGFIYDVKKIISYLPEKRQTMLFSATISDEIASLIRSILHDPVRIAITPVEEPIEAIEQALYYVEKKEKIALLKDLLQDSSIKSALVFTRTKHGANRVATDLNFAGIRTEAIHGNKSQSARERALALFKAQKIRILVATDIAARGLDISNLSLVVNYDLSDVPETYIHRIGRTGRAGQSGKAISFCSQEERDQLKGIQKHIKMEIPVQIHPKHPVTFQPVMMNAPVIPTTSIFSKSRPRGRRPGAYRGHR
ncbi:MAG: DEAD/DEAH box helicase [Bacilli bacterium]|nr:DEAD/DEAH box helicase [Bacilli bacterium]